MEIVHLVLRYAHLIGFAALTIGILLQWNISQRAINKLMLYGIGMQLITGIFLVGILEMSNVDVNMTKIMIKLGLLMVIIILFVVQRKKELQQGMYHILLFLIVSIALIAVFV